MSLKSIVKASGLRQTYISEKTGIPPARLSLIVNDKTRYVRYPEAIALNAIIPGASKAIPKHKLMPSNISMIEDAKMTQGQLAEATGIKRTRLNDILHGRSPMRDSERAAIAEALLVAPVDVE